MKRIAVIIFAFLAFATSTAQTIALGEKTPPLKDAKWLNGNIPAKNSYTYIGFIHSASEPCKVWAERIYSAIADVENISFILISRESTTDIKKWVMNYISPRSGIIVDGDHLRRAFGVSYAPFAVIIDHKRRALWFGNPRHLNKQIIETLISQNQ